MDNSFALTVVTFVVSLALLLYGAERFVSSTEAIGKVLGVPHFIMGITVLAIGTSLPELITGVISVTAGTSEIVIGTVLGSNIVNILLILGLTAIVSENFTFEWDLLHGDLPILFGSLFMLAFVVYPLSATDLAQYHQVTAQAAGGAAVDLGRRAVVSPWESVILVIGYVLYLQYYAVRNREEASRGSKEDRGRVRWKSLAWLVFGLVAVFLGARYTVSSAVGIAARMGLGEEVIAASFIAFGTSIPEMVVSLTAARHRNYEMALGNVTGSNIFNTFMVLGIPGMLAPWLGDGTALKVGQESVLFLQLPYYVATVLLFLVVMLDKTLTRTEGWVLFLAYLLFVGKLFHLI